MKILSFVTYYQPHWTGLTRHAVWLAEEMVAGGHEVTVLTTRHLPELAARERLNGVDVVRLNRLVQISRGMVSLSFPFHAARLISRSDVVQIHTPLPECLVVAVLCRILRRPLVMTHHGDFVTPGGFWNGLLQSMALRLSKASARLADSVTSYSKDYAGASPLLAPLETKLAVIPPPVRIPAPAPGRAVALRHELGLTGKRLIGIAGRWVMEKGFDDLLKALPLIREVFPDAHLVFAGEKEVLHDPAWERWLPLVTAQREHVTFLGLLTDRRELAAFYSMLDVFALPSRTEMMGIVQVEAMLCGTPVVATDIPGARTVVRDTGFGRIAPPGDPAGLAEAVTEVLRHPDRYRPDPALAGARFQPGSAARSTEALMRRALERRSGRARPGAGSAVPGELERLMRFEPDPAFRRRARRLMEFLAPRPGERVLDCGCGRGFHTRVLRDIFGCDSVGVDSSFDELAKGPAGPGLVSASADSGLPFADGTFDKVLMTEVLEHLGDDAAALAECRRVLRRDGVLAISVPCTDYPFLWDPINRLWTALGGAPLRSGPLVGIWTNHRRLYSRGDLGRLVEEAGFEVQSLEKATHHCLPFSHFLLYGIGKPLLESGWLPVRVAASVDRFAAGPKSTLHWNPFGAFLALAGWVDSFNERPGAAAKRTAVNLLVKARRV